MPTNRQEIIKYLSGPRVYADGVELYRQFGSNLMLLRRFQFDETETTREILFDELRKLAGLSEIEFARLPRKAVTRAAAPVLNGKSAYVVILDDPKESETVRQELAEAPQPVRKMMRFREKYTFLNSPDCPDILKVLVADMFTAYDRYKQSFADLQAMPDDADAAETLAKCEELVNSYLNNREIWDELEHYRTTGTILGKAAKFKEIEASEDLAALTDVELMKKIQSAKVNISKNKKRLAESDTPDDKTSALYQTWQQRLTALEAERDRRKKK